MMNIVNAGSTFQIYGEDIQTYKELPAKTYKVIFNKMSGFFLTLHNDLEVKEKVYGDSEAKVDKTLRTFKAMNRNMGIILSGPKGAGKSMFARMLAEKGNKAGLPLIIVDMAIPGVANFISSISQECIVLFDEFEKIFREDSKDDEHPQEELLSLFDGVDNGKKLFVITCNEVDGLNEYLLNRPGRFHYHFVLAAPSPEDVKKYMNDKLIGEARQYINKITGITEMNPLTYDALRAIAFDLNQGYNLRETMSDLNIEREKTAFLDFRVYFNTGIVGTFNQWTNFNRDAEDDAYVKFEKSVNIPKQLNLNTILTFKDKNIYFGEHGYYLDPKNVTLSFDQDVYLEDNYKSKEEKQEVINYMNNLAVEKITIETHKEDYRNKGWGRFSAI